ncbi:phosphomannomutase [Mycolicibacterium chitae]|uniref:Phosphomannomutase n=1 Tax=Mycolicibacterium chitae TaxID=1792 RepID=A0A448IA21_MYCCI|nr:phospho-sugar mutase [Mycolicibacterium chitae]BBZ05695.1 phosphomannomutase [Mycolicibacterium chitae]VEG49306.1 phosphomannomutase [Mycolicibacterium chitae]
MLRFGTAGLRGPMRAGPDGMNIATVSTATWAVAKVLSERGLGGATVVVGRDARHNSAEFALATAEVFAAEGFSVTLLPDPLPTPVVAYAVRELGAAAGVQITASHNPASDNGYKVYFDGGIQIVSPTDVEIETAIGAAPPVAGIARVPVLPAGTELVRRYLERAATVRRGEHRVRVALTPLHGVGGASALAALRLAGFDDVHVVAEQFEPDPDFPTVAFPNPEEPGAADAVLALAAEVGADLAIALDPDADRCAVGVPTPDGWRMLSGDETGWLLGDYVLSGLDAETAAGSVVASTVVSSRLLAAIAAQYGATHVETLTGFKWLARADADLPGKELVYAYEEAIGHCVDPVAVRDKDGISAAVLACDLVATLKASGRTPLEALDDLAARHGVYLTSAVSVRVDDAAPAMAALRADPPATLAGAPTVVEDLRQRPAPHDTDALIISATGAEAGLRMVVRPSGTEPKLKFYLEVSRAPVGGAAAALLDELVGAARQLGERLTAG